ncbi:hypothetical protein [Streptomyces sp. 2P-4]|uniref:hypothetical protein n=1 Tax=Streptomyces sp. 2P-4 TaxID=2931974 RepID=UPI00253F7128|nr:hypothetical protein [Streptomyces sp. 2P-4]
MAQQEEPSGSRAETGAGTRAGGAAGPGESEALALWCARLAGLRDQARVTGVGARLERDADRVRQGGSAVRAVRKWLQEDGDPGGGADGPQRSWSDTGGAAMVGFPGSRRPPSAGAGRYACPSGRCDRVAGRDAQGHVPVCHAYGSAMRPAPPPPAGGAP